MSSRSSPNQADSAEKLKKENFDLKMRMYYMQEKESKPSPGSTRNISMDVRNAQSLGAMNVNSDSFGQGHTDLMLQLEERNLELEQRNVLLSKARSAIDSLKGELKKARDEDLNEKQRISELEQRVAKMKQANEEIEKSCTSQIQVMEKEVVSAKEKVFMLEEAKNSIETKNEKLELELAHSEDRLKESRDEKDRLDEQWLLLQQKAEKMEEEVTQARAHVELFRMETQEAGNEAEELRKRLQVRGKIIYIYVSLCHHCSIQYYIFRSKRLC